MFIHAPLEARKARVASYSLAWSDREVIKYIKDEDRRRSDYYNYYTGDDWRDAGHFDISLDSELFGEDGCVEMIKKALPLFVRE
ncbi:hypothetical protein SDC9_162699 [bioreactor metagenome]|uniref:Cytidylate kinase n=1 Tax=bioreactor metagenome TaxID=1076179 RepID=A0A645FLS8_9ZZZZ